MKRRGNRLKGLKKSKGLKVVKGVEEVRGLEARARINPFKFQEIQTAMKITTNTTFARIEIEERNAHEAKILRAEAQSEAARSLLREATENGHDSEIWRDALAFAEAHESAARRCFAQWQQRDRVAAFKQHEFARILARETARRLEQIETETEQKLSCKIPLPKPRPIAMQSRC
jgi:hypothetical protein